MAAPTGIVYEQQVNGVACDHRSLEGFYVPLPATTAPVFDPGWWEVNENMRSSGGIGVETWRSRADEIERVLALMPGNAVSTVDVLESDENVEAWVHVKLGLEKNPGGPFDGVLAPQPSPQPASVTYLATATDLAMLRTSPA